MNLKEQITADMKAAMKGGNQVTLSVLRGLNAAFNNKAIEKRGKIASTGSGQASDTAAALTDEEMLSVVMSEGKKRKDSIAQFNAGNRPELAASEQKELEVIQAYLPKQMDAAEVEEAINRIMAESGAKEFGPLMKAVMTQLRGKADGQLVTDIIKKKLS